MPWTSHDLRNHFQALVDSLVALREILRKKDGKKDKYAPIFNNLRMIGEDGYFLFFSEEMPTGAEVAISSFSTQIYQQMQNIAKYKRGHKDNYVSASAQLVVMNNLATVVRIGGQETNPMNKKQQTDTTPMTILDAPHELLTKIASLGNPNFTLILVTQENFSILAAHDELAKNEPYLIQNLDNTFILYGRKGEEMAFTAMGKLAIPTLWYSQEKIDVSANDDMYLTLRKGHTPIELVPEPEKPDSKTDYAVELSKSELELVPTSIVEELAPQNHSWCEFFKNVVKQDPKKVIASMMTLNASASYAVLKLIDFYAGPQINKAIHAPATGLTGDAILALGLFTAGMLLLVKACANNACKEQEEYRPSYPRL